MSQESVSVKAKQRRRHTTFATLPPVIGQTAIYTIPMQSLNSRTDHEMSRQSMTIISNHSFNSNPSHAVSVNSSILSHAMAIPTILTIPLQSSILLQSQCNYSTNVPEYIELGQQPGTSVDLLRCDCKIAPQLFQDVSIDVQHVVHCSSRHQRKNSKQIKDKNAVYNRNTINNPTSFFVQSLTS